MSRIVESLTEPQTARARMRAGSKFEAEAGMQKMSQVFKETGGELYMGAGGREHD